MQALRLLGLSAVCDKFDAEWRRMRSRAYGPPENARETIASIRGR